MTDSYYGAGRVAVLSLKLFTAEKFNRLAECKTLADAVKILYESGYGEGLVLENPADFERLLTKELTTTAEFLKELSSNKQVCDCFLTQYDYLNAKILMKSKYLRLESLELCYTVGLIDAKTLAEYINVDEYNLLPTRMKEACEKIDIEFYEGKRNPKVVDITLDKAMFADILEMSSKCGVNSVKEYFQCVVDTTNILTMLRAKRAGIEADSFEEMFIVGATLKKEFVLSVYSEPFDKWINMFEDSPYARFAQCGVDGVNKGSLFECERLAEQYKRSILTPHNFELTVEPLVCYYLSKLAEIENVRMCLICIKNNFSAEQIKERIKSLYV